MSLNKFTQCGTGHELSLQIGADIVECNSIVTDSLDTPRLNGVDISGGIIGTAGPQGLQGLQGPPGPAGSDGIQGPPGPSSLGQSGVGALTARPITVELPCNASLFNTSNTVGRENLIVVIDSDGKIRPSLRFNPDSEHALILGSTISPVGPTDTFAEVAIGGTFWLTPFNGQVVEPGMYIELNGLGQTANQPGTIQAQVSNGSGGYYNPGYGIFAQAISGTTGNASGTNHFLAIMTRQQSGFTQDGNPN